MLLYLNAFMLLCGSVVPPDGFATNYLSWSYFVISSIVEHWFFERLKFMVCKRPSYTSDKRIKNHFNSQTSLNLISTTIHDKCQIKNHVRNKSAIKKVSLYLGPPGDHYTIQQPLDMQSRRCLISWSKKGCFNLPPEFEKCVFPLK